MINNVKQAYEFITSLEDYKEYKPISAYVSSYDDGDICYSFQMQRIGFEPIPGLTLFMVSVFADETVVAGNDLIEPAGGEEVDISKL